MNNIPINITVRHLDATPNMHSVIQDEVGKLEKFYNGVTEFTVIVEGIHNSNHGAELKRKVEITAGIKGNVLSATAEEENFGKALDSAVSKLKTQLVKQNEKLSEHKGTPTSELVQ